MQTTWYLDDGLLVGTPSAVAAALDKLSSKLAAIWLHLNTSKCELLCNENLEVTVLDAILKRDLGAPSSMDHRTALLAR